MDPEIALAAIFSDVMAAFAIFSVVTEAALILESTGLRPSIFSLVMFSLLKSMAAVDEIWLLETFAMMVLVRIKFTISV